MKKALIIVGSIVGLVIVALLVAPFLIPVDTYKSELLAQVEKATGRKARIDGAFGVSFLPRVEFTAGKVSFANAPGGKAPTMVALDRLDIRVAVFPLLSGTLEVDSFVLEKPVISLEVDRQGRPNWQFASAGTTAKTTAAPGSSSAGEAGGFGLGDVRLGDVRLVNGKVSYSDARTGASHVVDAINMGISLPSLSSPMAANGSLVWNKEKITLKLDVASPDGLLKGGSTALSSSISSRPVSLDFKGNASTGKAIKAAGTLNLDVPSVRGLAAWAGQPLAAPGDGLGPLKISGKVGVDGQKYAFTGAKFSLDRIEANGDFRFDGGGRKPYLNARLETGMLDINPYLPPEEKGSAGGTASPAPGARKAAPQGWSDDPIDLSGLRAADVDAVLGVAGLRVRKISIGKSQVKLALKGGRLRTELTEMALYDGNGKATIVADGSGAIPAVEAKFDLAGLKAHPALRDALDMERIEGTLNADLGIATKGKSQRAMMSALSGSGKVKFLDGAIRGINLAAMVRNVKSAFLDPGAQTQQKTDFAELSGTFRIVNGILHNDDLALLSPLLRVGGKGTVNLPRQTVDYRIEPKLAATSKGQGGKADVAGIMVPVIVTGPWHDISYRPDLAGMVGGLAKQPGKALENLKQMIPGQNSSGATTGSGGTSQPKPADAVKDVLKGLFGR